MAELAQAKAAITTHWGVDGSAVTLSSTAAHGGWVARAEVRVGIRTHRFSTTGLTLASAIDRLVVSSEWRAGNVAELASIRAS
jgi:hypothetical protein